MPTYAYRCTVCSEELEAKQSFTDDALTVCPACGGQLRKLFSSVGVVFKGSGFYRTDSRGSTRSTAGSRSESSTSTSGSSSTSGSTSSTSTSSSTSSASGSSSLAGAGASSSKGASA